MATEVWVRAGKARKGRGCGGRASERDHAVQRSGADTHGAARGEKEREGGESGGAGPMGKAGFE